jgi:long-chain acyl-CoA synthetase
VLIVVPNFDSLKTWARLHEVPGTVEELVRNPRVRARIQRDIEGRLQDFARFERPKKIVLLPREFSLELGEITPTMKIKRRVVEQTFATEIEAVYAEPADEPAGATA